MSKEVKEGLKEPKSKEFQWYVKFRSPKGPLAKMALGCEIISQSPSSSCEMGCEIPHWLQNHPLAAKMFLFSLWLRNGCEMISSFKMGCEMIFKLQNGCEMISKLQNGCEMISKLRNGCKITSKLRNGLQATKLTCKIGEMVCENTLWSQGKLRKWQQSHETMHLKRRAPCTLRSHT